MTDVTSPPDKGELEQAATHKKYLSVRKESSRQEKSPTK